MKTLFIAGILISTPFISISSQAADATMKADEQNANSACATDSQTANCGNEPAGHGLYKCIYAYKKAHPEFKMSASCAAAEQQIKSDRKAGK